jgi:hypothetical protein
VLGEVAALVLGMLETVAAVAIDPFFFFAIDDKARGCRLVYNIQGLPEPDPWQALSCSENALRKLLEDVDFLN